MLTKGLHLYILKIRTRMCPRFFICKGLLNMKKAMMTILLFSVFSVCLFADSFRFSIVWDKVIESETTLSVVNLENDSEVENHSKDLEIISTVQDVARIKYASNEGGIHVLSYKATPLMNNSDQSGHSFNLFFKYTENDSTDVQEIQVGTNKSLTYPSGSVKAETSINMGQGGVMTPKYVLIQVELPDVSVDSMLTNVKYTSTITIERTSP